MSPVAGRDAAVDPHRADDVCMHAIQGGPDPVSCDLGDMPVTHKPRRRVRAAFTAHPRQLPAVWLVVACFGVSLLAGAAAARAVVTGLAQFVGTVAAMPAGVLTFIVVSALALVLTARLDDALSR
jgi:hypothetical protein